MNERLRKEIVESNAQLEGWAWVEKALAMAELIEEVKPGVVVELGVFGGRSLIPQAMACRSNNKGVVIGVDPWRLAPVLEGGLADADKDWWTFKVDLHEIHKGFMEAVWKWGLEGWTTVVRGTSEEALAVMPSQIDIIHIDGNHSEIASCRDVGLYLPRVRPGGYVWFDDVNWPSTQKAVAMLDEQCLRVREVVKQGEGDCVLFKKGGV